MDKQKIGLMPGGFNLLHAGHLEALKFAKEHCDYLICVVVRDQSVRGHKLYTESIEDRYLKLKAVRWVDEVMPCESEESLLELLKLLNYDVYFLSEEYKDKQWDGTNIVGDKIHFVPRQHNWSTTNEVGKINGLHIKNKSADIRDQGREADAELFIPFREGGAIVNRHRRCGDSCWCKEISDNSSDETL